MAHLISWPSHHTQILRLWSRRLSPCPVSPTPTWTSNISRYGHHHNTMPVPTLCKSMIFSAIRFRQSQHLLSLAQQQQRVTTSIIGGNIEQCFQLPSSALWNNQMSVTNKSQRYLQVLTGTFSAQRYLSVLRVPWALLRWYSSFQPRNEGFQNKCSADLVDFIPVCEGFWWKPWIA